jgi:hypothetical protein
VCLCVCAEGIPSHISSLQRLGSVRDGVRLDISVSASDTVEFLRRVSVCICLQGIPSHINSMLFFSFGRSIQPQKSCGPRDTSVIVTDEHRPQHEVIYSNQGGTREW